MYMQIHISIISLETKQFQPFTFHLSQNTMLGEYSSSAPVTSEIILNEMNTPFGIHLHQ